MNTHKLISQKTLLSSMVALALASAPLHAQEASSEEAGEASPDRAVLERIVVTSQKRVQSLKDVPLSVSVMNAETIQDTGIARVEDFSAYVPNFTVARSPIGDSINIRGMQSGIQAGFEQSVGTFVNGIYRGRGPQSRFAFADVERIEVLRGPQSILFGKNTVAGALNIITARPDEDFNTRFSIAHTPEYDQTDIEGMVTGALSDTVRARLYVQSNRTNENYVENIFYPDEKPAIDEQMGRLTVEWDATSSTLVTLSAERSDFSFGSQPHSILEPGPLVAFGSFSSFDSTTMGATNEVVDFGSNNLMVGESSEYSLTSETTIEQGTVTFIAGRSEYDYVRFLDTDYAAGSFLRFDDSEDFSQNSIELRFTSNPSDSFEYMTGVYYQSQEMVVDNLSYFNTPALQQVLLGGCAAGVAAFGGDISALYAPGDAVGTAAGVVATLPGVTAGIANACGTAAAFDGVPFGVGRYSKLAQDADTVSVFAQGTWHVNDDLRATLGLRFTSEEKKAFKDAYATDFAESNKVQTDNPVVAAVASGAGEFSPHRFTPNDPGLTRKEDSPTWSLSVQYDLSSDAMIYSSVSTGFKSGGYNSFYMRSPTRGNAAISEDVAFEEEEVLSYEIGMKTTLLDGSLDLNVAAFSTEFSDLQVAIFSGNTTFEVQNAAQATSQGIEADFRWQATDALMITGSLGLLNFEYDDFKNQACTNSQFLEAREANFQQAATIPEKLGVVFGYNNALCAAAHLNDLSGRTPSNAPDVTASLMATHFFEIGDYELRSNLDVNYHSKTFRQDDLDPIGLDKAKAVVNASLIWGPTDGNWELALQGKNLTDRQSFKYVNDVPLFGGAHLSIPDQGRSYTLKFTHTYGN